MQCYKEFLVLKYFFLYWHYMFCVQQLYRASETYLILLQIVLRQIYFRKYGFALNLT